MNLLPVKLDDLIHARAVESVRLEFKKTWTEPIRDAVLRTVCAFANDLQGLNGGYIALGVEERDGRPVFPPHGLDDLDVGQVQKQIRGACNRIDPPYQPAIVAPETYMERKILIIWAPRGDLRPYQAPEHGGKGAAREYYVRIGSDTVVAKDSIRNQLLELTAKVSFDDRRRDDVPLSAISAALLGQFLVDAVGSGAVQAPIDVPGSARALKLSAPLNGGEAPRNVALLFFAEDPDGYFPGARIDVAHFRDDAGGDLIEVRPFKGPLPQQIRRTLEHLESLFGEVIQKAEAQPEAERFVAFPYEALKEAIVNAVYHRGYDVSHQPVRIGLYPDRLEITSYPGPVPGLRAEHLAPGSHPPPVPARNPRVGELLKSLRLAETWLTGVPKIHRRMRENGSPEARFDFDEARTYFRITLPAHPGYVALHALREAAVLWHTGERDRALARLAEARRRIPQSGAVAAQLMEYAAGAGDIALARSTLSDLEQTSDATQRHLAYLTLARALLDRGDDAEARLLLGHAPMPKTPQAAVDLAILRKRSGDLEGAHALFASVSSAIQDDPRALHEWAQVKMQLAGRIRVMGTRDSDARGQLNREAAELIRRVIPLAPTPVRAAWAWFDLARVLHWLRMPAAEVRKACERAVALLPAELRFVEWYRRRFGTEPPAGSAASTPT